MPKSITGNTPEPQNGNYANNANTKKTKLSLNQWELQHGFFKAGIFHLPSFAIHRNGEPIRIDGVIHGYRYIEAYHIFMHLKTISNDEFELQPHFWQEIPLERIEINEALTNFIDDPFLMQSIIKAVQA